MAALHHSQGLADRRAGARAEKCVPQSCRALHVSPAWNLPGTSSGFARNHLGLHRNAQRSTASYGMAVCRSAQTSEALLASSASSSLETPQSAAGPDLTLECTETGTTIHVFGVSHLEPQPHIGEWVLRRRPCAVLVETALGSEHGAEAGSVVVAGQRLADPSAAFYLRMFCQVGASLQQHMGGDFTASPLWGQVSRAYNGEQLAYLGALATGAPLVFADRPKHLTYSRLFSQCSLPQLDQGYSHAAEANYRSFLGLPPPPYDPNQLPTTERILMLEREAVMLGVVHGVCSGDLP
ncbi:hypothetical protein Agub_g7480, partial [Astrephomene gubernaculifera]